MLKRILTALLIILISACASTDSDTPFLSQPPVTEYQSLSDYWLSDNKVQPLKYLTRNQRKLLRGQRIEVKAKYLIDSNGNVHDVEIYESNVTIPMDTLVQKSLQNQDFYPSDSNSTRHPVVAYAGLSFVCH